jgi:uncharacterized protein YyaL (SSP411 family)
LELCDHVLEDFWDDESGTVYDTARQAETLVVRPRDAMDNATPSGPSLAAELLARAGHLVESDRYRMAARSIVDREAESLERFGPAFGRMLSVLDRIEAMPLEVVIVGGRDDETEALVRAAHGPLLRGAVIAGWLDDEAPAEIPLLRNRARVDGRPAAYVCAGYTCRLPVTDPIDVAEQIRAASHNPSSR